MKSFNVNETINVKLTPLGEEIYKHQHDTLNAYLLRNGIAPIPEPQIKTDDSGFIELQLWLFMKIFGKHFRMGQKPIIENNTIYFNCENGVDT